MVTAFLVTTLGVNNYQFSDVLQVLNPYFIGQVVPHESPSYHGGLCTPLISEAMLSEGTSELRTVYGLSDGWMEMLRMITYQSTE